MTLNYTELLRPAALAGVIALALVLFAPTPSRAQSYDDKATSPQTFPEQEEVKEQVQEEQEGDVIYPLG